MRFDMPEDSEDSVADALAKATLINAELMAIKQALEELKERVQSVARQNEQLARLLYSEPSCN